jgi:hypothetical protein
MRDDMPTDTIAPRHDPQPFGTAPRDYPAGVRFIRPHELARLNGEPVDLIEQLRQREREREYRRSLGERLVDFFDEHGDLCVGICIGIAVGMLLLSAAAYAVRLAVLS